MKNQNPCLVGLKKWTQYFKCYVFLNYFMIWGVWLLYILIDKRKHNGQIDKEKMIKLVIIK